MKKIIVCLCILNEVRQNANIQSIQTMTFLLGNMPMVFWYLRSGIQDI